MNASVSCVRCHTQATGVPLPSAPDAPGQQATDLVFAAAGTVFRSRAADASEGVENVHLFIHNTLVPDVGVEPVSNSAGNFYPSAPLAPATGLSVELEYQGQSVIMLNHPTPIQLYSPGTSILGVGCNGCHNVPAAPTPVPNAGPLPGCPTLPDAGTSDVTAGQACGGDLGCCSMLCIGGVRATSAGDAGVSCTSSRDCGSFQCVGGLCSDVLAENGHGCSGPADCRLGWCEAGICTGAPGRITIPSGVSPPHGGTLGDGYS